ncbi:MAG: hypothetical protein J5827_03835 [Oscillospiraceae bacterium]|nr:hypothetical protein [Oscillospiraceae bacterium]
MPKIIAAVTEISVCICVLWLISFLSALLHELGHAVGYMLATGNRHWHIRVGWGKKLLETKTLTVKLLTLDGNFDPAENRIDSKAKLIAALSGGPAVSLILAAALSYLKFGGVSYDSGIIASNSIEALITIALFCNVFIFVSSVIPARYFFGEIKGTETDGLKIINAIKDREAP